MAMAAAKTVISNDSGLMHIAAAIGTPAIGIFGPPAYHWAPLNGLAATIKRRPTCPASRATSPSAPRTTITACATFRLHRWWRPRSA
jgi:heptosyltransferase-2